MFAVIFPLTANSQALGYISDSDFAGFVLKNTNQLRFEIQQSDGYRLDSLLVALSLDRSVENINCLQKISEIHQNSYSLFLAFNNLRTSQSDVTFCE